jgi:hypothetical protein
MTRVALLVLLAVAGPVMAQFPQPLAPQLQAPPQRPVISPYLQLLNNNRSAASNYYNGVLPLQQLQNQQNQLNTLQNQLLGSANVPQATYPGTGSELSTGKSVGFLTHRAYFMNYGGVSKPVTSAGQYSTTGNNAVFSPQPANPSVMPFRR